MKQAEVCTITIFLVTIDHYIDIFHKSTSLSSKPKSLNLTIFKEYIYTQYKEKFNRQVRVFTIIYSKMTKSTTKVVQMMTCCIQSTVC